MASDPARNITFYTGVLGLRLVKKTVNFDDPGVYHFYFGDDIGSPGSILTFFPWPHLTRGTPGVGEAAATAYACPVGVGGWWKQRLEANGIATAEFTRFGQNGLAFEDHDGTRLEIIESAADGFTVARGEVATERALRGFHSVTLMARDVPALIGRLEQIFGLRRHGEEDGRERLLTVGGQAVDLVEDRHAGLAKLGAGSVHHVALRAADDAEQATAGKRIRAAGLLPTQVADRQYFRSIYFRDTSGVLFEVATDGPGFTVDEPRESLGRSLKLPPMYEHARDRIESKLPKLPTDLGEASPNPDLALHTHVFEAGDSGRSLLLLHGTGGDENDLLPLGRRVLPGANLLSPRGNVSENGAARFFRRFAEGVFDEQDAAKRSAELARWLVAARKKYGLSTFDAVGYSNGANTLGAMMLLGELRAADLPARVVLLRAMPVLSTPTAAETRGERTLAGVKVLMLSGKRDGIVKPEGAHALAERLRKLGAEVEVKLLDTGHELVREDLVQAGAFLADGG